MYISSLYNIYISIHKILQEFFLNVKCKIRALGTKTTINSFIKWFDSEIELNKKFHLAKHSIHKALCGKYFY